MSNKPRQLMPVILVLTTFIILFAGTTTFVLYQKAEAEAAQEARQRQEQLRQLTEKNAEMRQKILDQVEQIKPLVQKILDAKAAGKIPERTPAPTSSPQDPGH